MDDYQRFSAVLNKELERSRRRFRRLSQAFVVVLLMLVGVGIYLLYPDSKPASSESRSSESNFIQRTITTKGEFRNDFSVTSTADADAASPEPKKAPQKPATVTQQKPVEETIYALKGLDDEKLSPEAKSETMPKVELWGYAGEQPKRQPLANHLHWLLDEFAACLKSGSDDPTNPCNFFIAQALDRLYNIRDFSLSRNVGSMDAPGVYLPNLKIIDYVLQHDDQWIELGNAADQMTLEQAQQLANQGTAVIAFRDQGMDGVVALIMPGELKDSSTWGMQTPNSLSFLPKFPQGSYMGKSLSFAWKKSYRPEIKLFYRTGGSKISVASKTRDFRTE